MWLRLRLNSFVCDEGFVLTMMKEECLVTMKRRCCLIQKLKESFCVHDLVSLERIENSESTAILFI